MGKQNSSPEWDNTCQQVQHVKDQSIRVTHNQELVWIRIDEVDWHICRKQAFEI